jgi:hypothetical protein
VPRLFPFSGEPRLRAEEARYEVRRQLGWVAAIKKSYRDQRPATWLKDCLQDLHYGARTLRKSPGFPVVATLTLASGVSLDHSISPVSGRPGACLVCVRPPAFFPCCQ